MGVADIIGAQRLVLSPGAVDYLTTIARKPRGAQRHERAHRDHPPDRVREELRAARGQQVHVPGPRRAHKTQIRQAVEEMFSVRVLEVRTMSVKSKPKRRGYRGRTAQVEEGRRPAASGRPHRALRGSGDQGSRSDGSQAVTSQPSPGPPLRAPGRRPRRGHQASPEKSLTEGLKKSGGRNTHGRITSRHRGGGAKRLYRMIDFKRLKDGMPARVAAIEYDPNRTAYIALLHYADGTRATSWRRTGCAWA